ncbi:MAG TPA: sigma-70 family RNA polymerase sigma factor [Opitutaceae bacterium]|jgi:RNA polymerase sigma-70 factor (ECF subfamily)|nr:sigma-70 family RNA polymerase sigma factor [Opitutaceae bacterium]
MTGSQENSVASADGFGTTAWSLVLAAGKPEDGGQALERLCRKHWRPIYVFVRGSGVGAADAEDVTQDFFVYLLRKEWIKQADPTRGSFRAFLLTLLRNFLANHRRRDQAEKRGAGTESLSIDAAEGEREFAALAAAGPDPARSYEAAWANGVLQAAWSRLRAEEVSAGKAGRFEALRPFVTSAPGPGEYERLSQQLGMRRGQVALLIHRMSRRYAELVRAEVADTLADRSELEGELRHLLAVSSS